jgi:hypothetical protein
VVAVPPTGEKVRISPTGGLQPDWRGDGRELYYLSSDRTLTAVAVQPKNGGLEFGTPVSLFKARVAKSRMGA